MNIFKKAKGVFVPGKSSTPNVLAAFRCDFEGRKGKVELLIAAHSFYRVYINGEFLGIGPAPAPFGQLKADRYDLSGLLKEHNQLAIEVMGYVPEENNYMTHDTSCLFAEIQAEEEVLAATGDDSFTCGVLYQKDTQVESLSFGRRCPLEAYRLDEAYTSWRTGRISGEEGCEIVAQAKEETWKNGGEKQTEPGVRIIRERGVKMPDISPIRCLRMTGAVSLEEGGFDGKARSWWESDEYVERCGGENIKRPAFEHAGDVDVAYEGQMEETDKGGGLHEYLLYDYQKPAALEFTLEKPEAGFLGISFSTKEEAQVDLIWNDYLEEDGQVPVRADSTNRVIRLTVPGGTFSFEGMEPHYIKYIKVAVKGGGSFRLLDLYVRRYRLGDENAAEFVCSDMALNRIYEASRRTLLTNTLAFFLDSPERERGGWAGDSYWTGRAAAMLLSDTEVERSMLYDFLAADYSPMLKGTFPACCSGGKKNDPYLMYTWNLFVLLELTDYYRRTGDEKLKEDYRERVATFMEASGTLKNQAGVLENVPGSIFIDWSEANDQPNVSPISTAANGLYAMTADRLGEMYGVEAYRSEAAHIRKVFKEVYRKVRDSKYELFTMYPYLSDSMTLKDGELVGNGVYSEAAQYYYFWSELLTKEEAPELWKILKEQFGPAPEKYRGTAHLRVGNCGVFFGHMMRFEVLAKFGETGLLEKEMKKLCGYMVDQDPGTFWETLSGTDSRNHGFGSHYGVVLMRDFLGLDIPDALEKKVRFAPRPGSLLWAKGSVRLGDGRFFASWHKKGDGMVLSMRVPKGYKIQLDLPPEYCFCQKMTVNKEVLPFKKVIEAGNVLTVEL